jgi:BON domain
MRRVWLGLALSALALGPLSPARADDEGDRAAAQQIATMLRDSGQVRNYNIAVKYKEGVVRLEGRVTSQEQMNTALMLISDLDNVTQIVNGLSIGPGPSGNAAAKSSRKGRGSQTRLVSGQRPVPRGVPLGTAASGGASPVGYQQAQQAGYPQYPPGPPNYQQAQMGYAQGQCPPGGGGGYVVPGSTSYQDGVMDGGGGGGQGGMAGGGNRPMPAYVPQPNMSPPPAAYDQPTMPNYSWPSYAAYPNYAAVTYPKQYAASAWPYIGPFYPYPQVPLGWRKVTLEWDDGWWFLDFDDRGCH